MYLKTHKFFNQFTRQAMFEKVRGYVDKTYDIELEINRIKRENNLEKIYRFDLGENVDGCSPKIKDYLKELQEKNKLIQSLNEYPDTTYSELKKKISEKFQIPENNILVSSGLDSILDLITRVFFEYKDIYMMTIPSFYLFEEYSERMGAIPVFLKLKEEDNFKWTPYTTENYKSLVGKFRPKIIWIANPNNPTGQVIQEIVMEDIIKFAHSYNSFIVVDEAYGEYTDTQDRVFSASKFIHRYKNLIVLRTFSKKYGLASIRVGYLMCSSEDIIEAMLLHRHHFPVTRFSSEIARIAIKDDDFLNQSRKNTKERQKIMFKNLGKLKNFSFIPSQTNIYMIKNKILNANELYKRFIEKGIITSKLDITGLKDKNYLRVTLGTKENNDFFYNFCKSLEI